MAQIPVAIAVMLALLPVAPIWATETKTGDQHDYLFQHSDQGPSRYVREFLVPTQKSGPLAITVDSNGLVWFTETNASKVGVFDPEAERFTEYEISPSGGQMWGIISAGRSLWLTQYFPENKTNPLSGIGRIVRFDPDERKTAEFAVPTPRSFPIRLLMGADGRIWFTQFLANKLGALDPRTGQIEEYLIPSAEGRGGPVELTKDEEGNIWLTLALESKIVKFDIQRREFSTFTPSFPLFSPVGVAARGGTIWVADHGGNWIAKFSKSTGLFVKYPTTMPPRDVYPISIPNGLLLDAKGEVWFAEHGGNKIGRFNPETETLTEYHLPTGPLSVVLWIAVDHRQRIWFAQVEGNRIGFVDPTIPIPFDLSLSYRELRVQKRDSATLRVIITRRSESSELTVSISDSIFEIDPRFPQGAVLSKENNELAVAFSTTGKTKPARYSFAVSVTDGLVTRGKFVDLEVVEGASLLGFPMIFVVAAVVGGIGLAGWLVLRKLLRDGRTAARP